MNDRPPKQARRSSPRPTAGPGITQREKERLVPQRGGTGTPETGQHSPRDVLQDRWHATDGIRAVEVHWVDAVSTGDDWVEDGELDTLPAPSVALGYLVTETEHAVTVVALVNEVHYANGITIPKGCIVSMRTLGGTP